MSGNLVLRTMEVVDDIKAGVIWAGAVYSYEDFAKYRISDNSYRPPEDRDRRDEPDPGRETSEQVIKLRSSPEELDFNDPFWQSISLTHNLKFLSAPLQIHHAVNDPVVNIGYSRDLEEAFKNAGKELEVYEYSGGGHNIESPYFETAIQRTVDFYKEHL